VAAGRVVDTEELAPDLLGHEVVEPFSYPYEWSFTMLADAALLHLDLVLEALGEGLWTKDASAYNVTFRGPRPVFVDVGSFAPATGGPWPGYRQFCQHFLFPLLLTAETGVDFRPWLRSSLDGLAAGDLARLLPVRARLRSRALRHVVLPVLAQRMARRPGQRVADELAASGFTAELARASLDRLRATVAGLAWRPRSPWVDYGRTCSYTPADRRAKGAFVAAALAERPPGTVWDLGTNDGTYARMAADAGARVVAVDGDAAAVDALYRRLRSLGGEPPGILPLVVDLTNPSPAQGWRSEERAGLLARCRPTEVLALAVVHHLCLVGGIPLAEVVAWLASLGAPVVLELVHPEDPMADELLARTPPGTHDDYTVANGERLLGRHFRVGATEVLPSGTRTLYRLRPR